MSQELNILIVEDSDDDVLLIDQELRKGGINPRMVQVKTPIKFKELLHQDSWDVVIADYNLPEFNGFDALKLVQNKKLNIPFIFVSEIGGEEFAVKAVKAGANDYIIKNKLRQLVSSIKRELKTAENSKRCQQINQTLQENQSQYYGLFEDSPIPLWLEDLSAIKKFIDNLKQAGVTDFYQYFTDHPEDIKTCLTRIKIVDVNKETLKLYQAKSKEEIIRNPSGVFEQETYQVLIEELSQLASGHLKFESEVVTKTLKGEKRWLLLKLSVMPGYEETFSKVLVSTIDITERKNAEQELKIKEIAFSSSLTGIGIQNMAGKLTYVNQAMLEMWGYNDPSEVIGSEGIKYWHNRSEAKNAVREILTKRKWYGELKGTRKDGSVFDVKISATLITDEKGKPSIIIGSFEEITERKKVEQAIKESEAIFHALFEKNQAIILLLDVEDKNLPIVDANEAAVKYYGYSKETLLKMTIMDLNTLPPDEVRKRMAAARRQNKKVFQFKHRLACGEIRETESYSGPIDVFGRKLVYVVIQDISERKKMERALRESEEQFRTIFEQAPIGVAMIGLDLKVLKANRAYCETLCYTEHELKRMKMTDFIHPYDLDEILMLKHKLAGGDIPSFEMEKRFIKKDGGVVYGILRISLIYSGEGEPFYFLSQLLDITERKKAEEALKESEVRYRNLAENSPNAIIVHCDGKIVYANNQAMKILKYSSDKDFSGKDVIDLVHPAFHDRAKKRIQTNQHKGTVPLIEEKFVRLDGKSIDVEVAESFVSYRGRPSCQVVFRDITHRKRAEMVQELLYRISNAVLTSEDLNELFEVIRKELPVSRAATVEGSSRVGVGRGRPVGVPHPRLASTGIRTAATMNRGYRHSMTTVTIPMNFHRDFWLARAFSRPATT